MIYFLYLVVGVIAMIYAERLRALREDADKKQSEIAEYLGYSSQSYFQKVFKSRYGITPGEYRNKRL